MSQKKSQKPVREPISFKTPTNKNENTIVSSIASSEVSEETVGKTIEEVKEIYVMDEAPVCNQSNGTHDETVEENAINDDKVNVYQKIEVMDSRIKNLRKSSEKLLLSRCLSILLYQSMEVHHTRFILQLSVFLGFIFMLANIGLRTRRLQLQKNTVSGLVLIAKSCGNDVSRLTFWLSNMVVLGEIICQAFGNLFNFNATMKTVASNGGARKTDEQHTTLKWKNNSGNNKGKKPWAVTIDI